jgi:hypothetical protein
MILQYILYKTMVLSLQNLPLFGSYRRFSARTTHNETLDLDPEGGG